MPNILIMVFIKLMELFKGKNQVFIKILELLYMVIILEYQLMVMLLVLIMVFI